MSQKPSLRKNPGDSHGMMADEPVPEAENDTDLFRAVGEIRFA